MSLRLTWIDEVGPIGPLDRQVGRDAWLFGGIPELSRRDLDAGLDEAGISLVL